MQRLCSVFAGKETFNDKNIFFAEINMNTNAIMRDETITCLVSLLCLTEKKYDVIRLNAFIPRSWDPTERNPRFSWRSTYPKVTSSPGLKTLQCASTISLPMIPFIITFYIQQHPFARAVRTLQCDDQTVGNDQ